MAKAHDPILAELEDRLSAARAFVRTLEQQVEERTAQNAKYRAALDASPNLAGSPSSAAESAESNAPAAPVYGRASELNPGRSWQVEIRKALAGRARPTSLVELVEDLEKAGMKFGDRHKGGMVSTQIMEGVRRGRFLKTNNGLFVNNPAAHDENPYLRTALNSDGKTWAQVIDEVLTTTKVPMTVAQIAKALVDQGRNFGKGKPSALVRTCLKTRAESLGWARSGSKWTKVK